MSLSTSGMYLGSAAGMLILPSVAARASPAALLKFVGALGYAWLAFWLTVGKEVPHRCETTSQAILQSSAVPFNHISLLRVTNCTGGAHTHMMITGALLQTELSVLCAGVAQIRHRNVHHLGQLCALSAFTQGVYVHGCLSTLD